MITKWKVYNFKSIREETELTLGPLTIFAGANSSGKSTFIQSILLVAQTLANKVTSRSVVLNGSLTNLGQFDDLKSNTGDSDQIVIKCTCNPLLESDAVVSRKIVGSRGGFFFGQRSNQLREIACEISFDADPSSPNSELFQIQPRLFASRLSCISRDDDNLDQSAEISVRQSSKLISEIEGMKSVAEIGDQLRASLDYDVDIDDLSMTEVNEDFRSAQAIGCVLRHFLPERVIYEIDTLQENVNAIVLELQDDARRSSLIRRNAGRNIILSNEVLLVLRDTLKNTIDFDDVFKDRNQQMSIFDIDNKSMSISTWHEGLKLLPREKRLKIQQVLRESDDLFDRILEASKTSTSSSTDRQSVVQIRPPRQIMDASAYLDNFFAASLKYLGPLRDSPKPLYPLAPAADPYDVGLRGEHTAAILDLHKNKKIKYIPSINFSLPVVDRKTVTRTLESAVTDWLQYLGVATKVISCDKGKLGHELKVVLANADSSHDLTHVGVGVSQVLPILVMCLLAEPDSTLVFEQPELHLHPKVQTLLGDFFLSMALSNKQCIVETHSEYFVDRIRFRIAAATSTDELNSKTKIYFVEKNTNISSFREVVINEYGAITDWPEGFFDQSQQQAEAILRAAAAKRKAKREKNNG